MMTQPLTISSLIDHAARYHSGAPIFSVETTGGTVRRTWGQTASDARRLASALAGRGLTAGDRCATIAWNNYRHLEIYFGVSGSGLVCHTLNPRLSAEQMVYIINHAQDRILFVDQTFLPIVAALSDQLPTLGWVVLMGPRSQPALDVFPDLIFYDELIEQGDPGFDWPAVAEDAASSLCYTSGTTGDPKGVLYSHRSTVLHTLAIALPDSLNVSSTDTLLPVVPMFHVNAWGIPYAAAMCGASLVMPGPGLDGDSLVDLIDKHRVTTALGVPTIWHNLLASAKTKGSKLESLVSTVVGGSACPPSMIQTFRQDFGVDTIHAWGMTEMSPVGTVNRLLGKHLSLPSEQRAALRLSQGRPPFGVELKIVGDDGSRQAEDGVAQGDLLVRGHWIVERYFKSEQGSQADGWFHTGDISTIDADGFMSIKDRSKDVIKSGGEWISSVELEGLAIGHPDLADAAVIGVTEAKWGERPILIAVAAPDRSPDAAQVLAWLEGKVPKWHVPDAVIFTDVLPRNATGKVLKRTLRERYANTLATPGTPS